MASTRQIRKNRCRFYAGLPIIATDVRGNRDLVRSGENGYSVPIDDVKQTSIAIERLIDSENLRRSMGEKSKELVKRTTCSAYWKRWRKYTITS